MNVPRTEMVNGACITCGNWADVAGFMLKNRLSGWKEATVSRDRSQEPRKGKKSIKAKFT